MKRVIALIVLPVALAGCGSSDGYTAKPAKKVADVSFKPGDEASLMPLEVGNQWVYSIESAQGTSELTLKVSDVKQEGDATVATMSATMSGPPASPSAKEPTPGMGSSISPSRTPRDIPKPTEA